MQQHRLEGTIRCCLLQLYGDLQPRNAEPLSIEALASAVNQTIPGTSIYLSTIGTFQSPGERNDIVTSLLREQYDLLGLSCPQGTYKLALEILSTIYHTNPPPYVLLGHALPTSLPELFLLRYPRCLVVRGWGEPAVIALCQQIVSGMIQLEQVPGLTYVDERGARHDTPAAWAEDVPPPIRINPARYFARIEASRGCHYNLCTFCSRPPRPHQQHNWMRLDHHRVLMQVEQLVYAGVTSFTFADEDFIGNDLVGALEIAKQLCRFPCLDFALSVRTDNVINASDSSQERRVRQEVFHTLQEAGLSLVFLGIESFAPTQLHRFGKGTSPECSIEAIRFLESLAIEVELGLILFDPLASLEELSLNVSILRKTGLWRHSGQMFSFLRPQVGTPYVKLLKQYGLLGPLHPNTAEYQVSYLDGRVEKIMCACKAWNRKYHPLYMALRNVHRSELGTGQFTHAIHRYRYLQLQFLHSLLRASAERRDDIVFDSTCRDKDILAITQSIQAHLCAHSERSSAENELLRMVSSPIFA